MSKKSTPIPCPAQDLQSAGRWFFRDRAGHRFGPYTDAKEIRTILTNHCVGKSFEPARFDVCGLILRRPATGFIMEDAENNSVCPGDWLAVEKAKRHEAAAKDYRRRYGHHVHRSGPVAGIHKPRYWKMWRTPDFGRKVRDTGHGCAEDDEPQIRVKRRVRCYAWDDFAPCRARKSWKHYRAHQWR